MKVKSLQMIIYFLHYYISRRCYVTAYHMPFLSIFLHHSKIGRMTLVVVQGLVMNMGTTFESSKWDKYLEGLVYVTIALPWWL